MSTNMGIDWTELSIQWMLTCGHFLWQGFAVAFALFVMERLVLKRASTRYAVACTALMSLPICVVITFAVVHNSRGSILRTTTLSTENVASLSDSLESSESGTELDHWIDKSSKEALLPRSSTVANQIEAVNEDAEQLSARVSQRVRFLAATMSVAYAIVVSLLLLRMSLCILGSLRLRSSAQPVTDPQLLQVIVAQAARLKLKVTPIVATCVRVSSPVVVGIVRPMIFLPPSLLCGLDPIQLAAILSHEMAHIRRYDLLVNLLQRVVEALFFFHPITWWISRRVTLERESCCDDVAALHVGRLTYAEALLQMASICLANHRSPSEALATLAADGGNSTDFGYRIRRLIDAQQTPQIGFTKRSIALGCVTAALICASLVSLAQGPQTKKDESQLSQSSKDKPIDGVQWSTWGDRDGLLSGARLILPNGGARSGQPIVVEYRLKNVSTETKKLSCYIRGNWQYITIDTKNCISDMGIDTADNTVEISIEPGKEYVATSSAASIDTRGLPPGEYQVALGSAFYCPDAENPGAKYEIPHRGSIPLTIFGEPNSLSAKPLENGIHWGGAVAGLRLGAKFLSPSEKFRVGNVVEADLWIGNVTDQPIACSIRLPHPMDGWLFNIENHLSDTVTLERPPMISSLHPQDFYEISLAPGEVKALTGEPIEGQPDAFAGRRAKFEIVSSKEDQSWTAPTIKGRLVSNGGEYSAIYNVMLDRPDVPGLRIELDTGNYPFTVGQPDIDPAAARLLDEATDKSIRWGEPSGGMRLGIRQSEFSRRRTVLRHGEHIDYEVWIKNETDEVVQIERDPRDVQDPRLMDDQSINVIGSTGWLSFSLPPMELAKAELILPPGQSARRFLYHQHSASIRPPGSPRGRFGSEPLHLERGKYPVYAQLGELKSGVEEVEIIPAARLQVRKAGRVTEKKREYAAKDPSDAILSWQTVGGEKQEVMFDWDGGVLIDERDLASIDLVPVKDQPDQSSIALRLKPESSNWLARRIESYSQWEDPTMVAILFDGKLLGDVNISSPIPEDTLIVPSRLPRQQAESISNEIRSTIAQVQAEPKAIGQQ